jgi:hypothetical protein
MLLIALLMAASLVSTPCAGGAVEPKLPLRVPDYPPGEQYGDPEVPNGGPRAVRYPVVWDQVSFAVRQAIIARFLPSVSATYPPAKVVRGVAPERRR